MVFNAAPALAWGNCDYSKKAQSTSESSMQDKVEDTAPSSKDKKN